MANNTESKIGDGAPCSFWGAIKRLWFSWPRLRGRASRSEFWYGIISCSFFYTFCKFIGLFYVWGLWSVDDGRNMAIISLIVLLLTILVVPLIVWVSISFCFLFCRRLHDIGASAWFIFPTLLAVIALLWLPGDIFRYIVCLCIIPGSIDSNRGTNAYGPSGKYPFAGTLLEPPPPPDSLY